MALTYANIGAVPSNTAFIARVTGALIIQSIAVNAEANSVANHVQRLQLLGRVIASPAVYATEFAPVIAAIDPILSLASVDAATDANILSGVAAVWDAFALRGI